MPSSMLLSCGIWIGVAGMRLLGFLHKFERGKAALPVRFEPIDFVRAFWELGKGARISRSGLAKKLGLGEGSVRTIIFFLLEEGLIDVSRDGCALSTKGSGVLGEFGRAVCASNVSASKISFEQPAFLVRVRGAAFVGNGQVERDLAVKMGAEGATLFFRKKGRLFLPFGVESGFFDGKTVENIETACAPLEDGDFFILAFGKDEAGVERGAWSVALKLLEEK